MTHLLVHKEEVNRTESYVRAGCVQFKRFSLTRCCHTRHDVLCFGSVTSCSAVLTLNGSHVHRYFWKQGLKKQKEFLSSVRCVPVLTGGRFKTVFGCLFTKTL